MEKLVETEESNKIERNNEEDKEQIPDKFDFVSDPKKEAFML